MSADATAGLLRAPARAVDQSSARERLAATVARRTTIAVMLAHGLGAIDVFALLMWVLPMPPHASFRGQIAVNAAAFAVLIPLGAWVGWRLNTWASEPARRWLRSGAPPTLTDQRAVLRMPLMGTAIDAALWAVAAALFAGLNAPGGLTLAGHVGTTIVLGGMTTCAVSYLLGERLLRPVTALALADGPPSRRFAPGMQCRLLLTWVLTTGVPVLSMGLVALQVLSDGHVSAERTAISVLVLGAVAVAIGLVGAAFSARSVADPVCAVRDAMARVEAGDLDATVAVDDGSEVGLLQAGFNRMAAGLRERERLRDLFGRHVGEAVARAALDVEGVRLGGETRDVSVFFVDLVGSTGLAGRQPPERVVALLNRFFAIVVEVVDAHGGWVDKFQGDGAMCVFGAPAPLADAPAAALAAARELRGRLRSELPQLDFGVGVSAGPAVAGNVGTEARFEYTVIGDPVNEASRLCDLAKQAPGRVLASGAILERGGEEATRWRLGEETALRGRSALTRVGEPAELSPA